MYTGFLQVPKQKDLTYVAQTFAELFLTAEGFQYCRRSIIRKCEEVLLDWFVQRLNLTSNSYQRESALPLIGVNRIKLTY